MDYNLLKKQYEILNSSLSEEVKVFIMTIFSQQNIMPEIKEMYEEVLENFDILKVA